VQVVCARRGSCKSHNDGNAAKFITPLTFEAITGNRVSIDDFEQLVDPVSIKHIDLAGWADLFVLAPATANTISKIANGVCDNLLTSTVLAYNFRKPFLYCSCNEC